MILLPAETVSRKQNHADSSGKEAILAHLSRSSGGAFSIGRLRRPSVFRPSTISNDFSSETTEPIATKFHIQPPGPLGKKIYSNGLGHMTNMAAMPIYGKNLKKIFFPRTNRPMTLKLNM